MKIRFAILFTFNIEKIPLERLGYLLNGWIREYIEQNLPAGWLMKPYGFEIDGELIDHTYE